LPRLPLSLQHPFRPAYASVATFVRALNASVLVAKVDGETEAAAARRHGLQALPALVWFVDGKEEAQFPGEELTG
jgi:thioredoxin-like negative regulator of GroEL